MSNLLARATSRSLILLDEFGKGTLSADGVGLLASLLQHYAAQPCPPLLLACTHFSELLDPGGVCFWAASCGSASNWGVSSVRRVVRHCQLPWHSGACSCDGVKSRLAVVPSAGILPRSPQLSLCTMQVLVGGEASAGAGSSTRQQQEPEEGQGTRAAAAGPPAAESLDDEHVFLFKLVPGVVASSYGLHCARLCGVDHSVLMRAAAVLALREAGQPVSRLQVRSYEDGHSFAPLPASWLCSSIRCQRQTPPCQCEHAQLQVW